MSTNSVKGSPFNPYNPVTSTDTSIATPGGVPVGSSQGIAEIDVDSRITFDPSTATVSGLTSASSNPSLNLTPEQRTEMRYIGYAAMAGGPSPALQSRWSNFIADMAAQGGAVDVNALVQAVLRESYMQTTEDLRFYAEKVKFFNELKKSMREELTKARNELAKYAGKDGDAALSPPYQGVDFNSDFTGTTAPQTMALQGDDPSKLSGGGLRAYTNSPTLNPPVDSSFQKFVTEPGGYVVAYKGDQVRFYKPDGTQMGYVWGDPHYQKGTGGASLSGEGVMHFGDDSTMLLPDGTKVCMNCENVNGGEYYVSGITMFSGDKRVSLGKQQDGTTGDNAIHGDRAEKDSAWIDSGATGTTGVMAIQDDGNLLVHIGNGEFKRVKWENWSDYQNDRDIDTDGAAMRLSDVVTMATADGAAVSQRLDTKEKLETYIKNVEEKLSSAGDDAQLANVDLQNVLQKQQQTLQMISTISKLLHDTAMAIVRKIGN